MDMNRLLLSLFGLVALASAPVLGQNAQLKAYIDHKNFYSPASGAYAELHLQFAGYTLKYQPVENGLQTKVAIRVAIVNTRFDTVAQDAYVLESPVMRDSIIEDFYDIIRFPLEPGSYSAVVSLSDLVSNSPPLEGKIELNIPASGKETGISDILIAEVATPTTTATVFSKSGYEIIPRIANFYPEDLSGMPYYVELYHTNLINDSLFALRQRIVNSDNNIELTDFTRISRLKTADVVPVLRNLDISKLPSGSYYLELTALDRNMKEVSLSSTYYFERVNELEVSTRLEDIILDPSFQASITDDSLDFYLGSLIPISRPAEGKNILAILKTKDEDQMRKYMQQFWLQTAGTNAAAKWLDYKKQVLLAQELYGNSFMNGYETDRGRVFLQYGPPNSIITRESSPSEYPYEIWHYYKIKVYSNKRFVFYNPDLVNNNYRLLHSDMVGEQQNYRWQVMLNKRNSPQNNLDNPQDGVTNQYGGNSNYYYRQD